MTIFWFCIFILISTKNMNNIESIIFKRTTSCLSNSISKKELITRSINFKHLRQSFHFRRVRRDYDRHRLYFCVYCQKSNHHSNKKMHSLRTLLSREERMSKQTFSFKTRSLKSKKSIKSRRSRQQTKKKKRQKQWQW
jgi:hypothetical protein